MGLQYRTEYDLGRWGGHVRRSYGGLQAFLAIILDLLLSLVFGVIWFALSLVWGLLLMTVRFVVEVLKAPLRAMRWTLGQVQRIDSQRKPACAGFDDV